MNKKSKKNILLVDDEPSIHLGLSIILNSDLITVCSAANGKEGMDQLQKNEFDLVITDLRMPEKSGFELFDFAIEYHKNLPFIFLSASFSNSDKLSLKEKGAKGFFPKPIPDIEAFKEFVYQILLKE